MLVQCILPQIHCRNEVPWGPTSALGTHKCFTHMMQPVLKQGDLMQPSQLQAPFSMSEARMTAQQQCCAEWSD